MKPDSYMPYYGNDLFSAIEGFDDATGLGYHRAIWHYWHECHTEGLPNDDDYLRRICRIDQIKWARTKPIIFGRWFKLDAAGMWQNKRSQEEWDAAAKRYAANLNRARLGAEARWKDNPENAPANASSNAQAIPEAKPEQCLAIANQNNNNNQNKNHNNKQNQKQLIVERSTVTRSVEKRLIGELQDVLGKEEMERAGGHWRKNHVRKHPELVERALAEVKRMVKEGEKFTVSPGACLTDLIKRWS